VISQTVELTYPREWHYKVFCSDEERLKIELFDILDKKCTIEASKVSKKGKYKSFLVVLDVESADERDSIFRSIKALESVVYVL